MNYMYSEVGRMREKMPLIDSKQAIKLNEIKGEVEG